MRSKLLLPFTIALSFTFLTACHEANNGGSNTAAPPAPQATTTGKAIGAAKAGDLTVTLTNPQGQFKDGDNDFTVAFRNTAGQPVDTGAITMFIDMPGMPPTMPYMKNNVRLVTTNTPGIYQATVHLEMGGTWNTHIAYKGSAGEGKMEFPVHVK